MATAAAGVALWLHGPGAAVEVFLAVLAFIGGFYHRNGAE
ncbi:hypothetical protein HEB94_006784 [Actinopolymorpha pittospori]|uniref:Uncharacterized protein n=1 Tax=Actinopolymorpha pittospori TaxID=648752 RepID=A0A927MZP9_9ACTN|nr:hypothetical protein [Actinopolymorpha pittospori]